METENTCNICTEKFNLSTRSKCKCPYCSHEGCRDCYKKWLLMESTPRCMNNSCNVEWTQANMADIFPYAFISKDYKKHRENVLFDKERALLPATQPEVERIIRREVISKEMTEVNRKIQELKQQYRDLHNKMYENGSSARSTERSSFIRACPDGECRGFLSSQWKCGLCQKWTCPDCHEIKGEDRECDHTCDPDRLATARLLENDTKICPSCGTGIYRVEGCDQIWCTGCNSGFNWRTGRKETNIHNPHYFEWLRRTGGNVERDANDIQCGQEITSRFTREIVAKIRERKMEIDMLNDELDESQKKQYPTQLKQMIDNVTKICENAIHNRYVVIDRFRTNNITDNQELRIKYLRKMITEEEFKRLLQREDKRTQKYRSIFNILTMVATTVTDIIYRFRQRVHSNDFVTKSSCRKDAIAILDETKVITKYANECLQEISKTYKSKLIQFSPDGRASSST